MHIKKIPVFASRPVSLTEKIHPQDTCTCSSNKCNKIEIYNKFTTLDKNEKETYLGKHI